MWQWQEIVSIAPFLSKKFIDDYATKLMEKNPSQPLDSISCIAPFVSTDMLDKKAVEILEQSGDLKKLIPIIAFLSRDLIDYLADTLFEKTGDFGVIGADRALC